MSDLGRYWKYVQCPETTETTFCISQNSICDSKEFNDCIFKPYVSDCCPDGSDELHCNGMNDILSTYVEFLEDIQINF